MSTVNKILCTRYIRLVKEMVLAFDDADPSALLFIDPVHGNTLATFREEFPDRIILPSSSLEEIKRYTEHYEADTIFIFLANSLKRRTSHSYWGRTPIEDLHTFSQEEDISITYGVL
ncbi:hypothetical protein IMZ31_23405 (plasmid) [Pontibacillus sp. ALD_SL1]|uniref:hypothetical protein n=1 Tax=Pontibacillus sp. ALD_SL1 TaxID=2777185 RepID=UPI001A970B19|nr:hypothetical protein [Pontibacillus sp. ALD_SL1]QST02400.1 hypothetical protein IMZ31_23405 [Pontibacillus sp. ALD_SL1]